MHEHLDEVALIHMNGRIYDPLIARFITPDPFIQAPYNLQSYNRYSYVFNNPLRNYDPSGYWSWKKFWREVKEEVKEFVHDVKEFVEDVVEKVVDVVEKVADVIEQNLPAILAIGAAVFTGGVLAPFLGITSTFGVGALSGFVGGFVGSGGNIEAGIIGALTGGIGAAAGAGIGGMLTRAAVSCVSSAASGGNCGRAALASGFSEWAGGKIGDVGSPAANMARNAVIGGTVSALGGGKFANGAVTGSFSYLFSQMHNGNETANGDTASQTSLASGQSGGQATGTPALTVGTTDQLTPTPLSPSNGIQPGGEQIAMDMRQLFINIYCAICWQRPPPPPPLPKPTEPIVITIPKKG